MSKTVHVMLQQKSFLGLLIAFCVWSVLTGCNSKGDNDTTSADDPVLNLIWDNSARGSDRWPYPVGRSFQNHLLFNRLVALELDLSHVKPEVATDWEVRKDGLQYVFHLRKDVLWHDGNKLDADDVVVSFHAFLGCARTPGREIALIGNIEGIDDYRKGTAPVIRGITKEDDYTVRFVLDEPSPTILMALSRIPLVPAHLVLKDTSPTLFHQSKFWEKPVGSGPFRFVRRVSGDFTELHAHESYFEGAPKIKRIMIRRREQLLAASSGQLDFTIARDPAAAEELARIGGMAAYPIQSLQKRELWINTRREGLDQVQVRKAIAYAIDRDELTHVLIGGNARPWYTVMTPSFWANTELPPIEYDPELSKELLKSVGWDKERKLDLVYYHADPLTRDMVTVFQSYLDKVGIKVSPRMIERDVSTIINVQHNYDIVFGAANGLDGSFLETYSTEKKHSTGYSNTKVDELLAEAAREADRFKRKRLYDEVQRLIREDMPVVPLFVDDFYLVQSSRLQTPVTLQYKWFPVDLRIHDWMLNSYDSK